MCLLFPYLPFCRPVLVFSCLFTIVIESYFSLYDNPVLFHKHTTMDNCYSRLFAIKYLRINIVSISFSRTKDHWVATQTSQNKSAPYQNWIILDMITQISLTVSEMKYDRPHHCLRLCLDTIGDNRLHSSRSHLIVKLAIFHTSYNLEALNEGNTLFDHST